MKDADDAIPSKHFEIKAVDLGLISSKGKPITGACIVGSTKTFSLKIIKQSKEDIALACFNADKKEWQKAYVATCTAQIDNDSKKSQYRNARKNLIEDGRVLVNEDGSYSLNDAA
jgi:hypothetical protein